MPPKALVLTDGEADVLSCVLEEVKTKTVEESQISLDDEGALCALVSHFRDAEKLESDKEARQISVNPSSKRQASLRPPVRLPRLSTKTSDPYERDYGPSAALKRTPQLPAVMVYQFKAVICTDASHHPQKKAVGKSALFSNPY